MVQPDAPVGLHSARSLRLSTTGEHKQIAEFIATMDAAIAAGSVAAIKDWDAIIVQAAVFLVYELAMNHPGLIPPVWPK